MRRPWSEFFILSIACSFVCSSYAGSPVREAGYSPDESLKHMGVAEGFNVTLFAGEPDVRQPIACCLDDRGRLWVAENYDYRSIDKTKKNKNRILIFEDIDGDGRFDKSKIFMDQLGYVSAVQIGFGGVWIGMAPQFIFVPDRNGDDVPDSAPVVLLDGFDAGAWHFLNNIEWGPDGWLYGCHGTSAYSKVGKPGTPMPRKGETGGGERQFLRAGIWRYHPTQHRFEIFAHGFSNPWGIDWDDRGQMFMTCCIIPPLWHVIQGGRFEDQSGIMYSPFTYDWIKTIYWKPAKGDKNPPGWKPRPGGAPGGALIYMGDSFPDEYRGKLLSCSVHSHSLLSDRLESIGSGFKGFHETVLVQMEDANFMGFHVTLAPDGGVYFLDWNSRWSFNCHGGAPGDADTGRIYKLQFKDAKPVRVDLAHKTELELVALHLHKNEWFVRHARRLLQERAAQKPLAPDTVAALHAIVETNPDAARKLRAFWTLHAAGALNAEQIQSRLNHADEYMRAWAIQFLCENNKPPESALARFENMAKDDHSPKVRLYLAAALQRMSPDAAWPIARALSAHAEDASDHNLPLMLWYGVEPLVAADLSRGKEFLKAARNPLLQEYAARRMANADDARKAPEALTHLMNEIPSFDHVAQGAALRGISAALLGRRNISPPPGWDALKAHFAQTKDSEIQTLISGLGARFGDAATVDTLLEVVKDDNEKPAFRCAAIEQLAAASEPRLPQLLGPLLRVPELRAAAMKAGRQFNSIAFASALIGNMKNFDAALRADATSILVQRSDYVKPLVEAIRKGILQPADFSATTIRNMAALHNLELDAWIKQHWGSVRKSNTEKLAEIQKLTLMIASAQPGEAVPARGQEVFKRTCFACHALFDEGGKAGPDLTQSARRDLKYLLENIADPSSSVAKEYQSTLVRAKDGRVLSGLVRGDANETLTLVTAAETVVLKRAEIASTRQTEESMMPEGLLNNLSRRELLDLVAYLQSDSRPELEKK